MRSWTVHLHERRPVVLVPERFSLAAMVLGPFWLMAQRAWIAAALVLAAHVVIAVLGEEPFRTVLGLGLAWLVGLSGQDIRRRVLARRGYRLAHVVVAANEAAALARVFAVVPGVGAGELVSGKPA